MQPASRDNLLNLPIAPGFEAHVSFERCKITGQILVRKQYRLDCECVVWLNSHLARYYDPKIAYPVAQHEFAALQLLQPYEFYPDPVELLPNGITMAYAGIPLAQARQQLTRESFLEQAETILGIFEKLELRHNDLLPWNVLVDGDRLRVIDFTLSEFAGRELMSSLPNPGWAQAGKDRQLLEHYGEAEA